MRTQSTIRRVAALTLSAAIVTLAACKSNTAKEEAPVEVKPTETVAAPDHHNARLSLDWAGTYKGVTPCADCEGIETELVLNGDNTYTLNTKYLGKGDGKVNTVTGSWAWSEDGNVVILDGITNAPNKFHVGENHVRQLDMEGKRIEGDMADKYKLDKQM